MEPKEPDLPCVRANNRFDLSRNGGKMSGKL